MKFLLIGLLLLGSCSGKRSYPTSGESSWDRVSGTFRWPHGQITVPAGLYYSGPTGGDSFEGTFYSLDERLRIEHDIGFYAGVWAKRKGALIFEERLVEGARVRIAQEEWGPPDQRSKMASVSFPDNGYANFHVESKDSSGLAVVRAIARSFHPQKTKKASFEDE